MEGAIKIYSVPAGICSCKNSNGDFYKNLKKF